MKPINALELSIPADLTFYSVFFANNIAIEALFPDRVGVYKKDLYTNIVVASQGVKDGIPMAYAIGAHLEVSCDYNEDEWSITVGYYDSNTFEKHESVVWSPGA